MEGQRLGAEYRPQKTETEERSLYSLFRNVNPEKLFDYLKEIGMFYKV